jgi:hypothetical protein
MRPACGGIGTRAAAEKRLHMLHNGEKARKSGLFPATPCFTGCCMAFHIGCTAFHIGCTALHGRCAAFHGRYLNTAFACRRGYRNAPAMPSRPAWAQTSSLSPPGAPPTPIPPTTSSPVLTGSPTHDRPSHDPAGPPACSGDNVRDRGSGRDRLHRARIREE